MQESERAAATASHRSGVVLAVTVGCCLSLPALGVGFTHDDLLHRLILEGQVPGFENHWLSLYDFTPPSLPTARLIERGFWPWFAVDELSIRFFRPLSSLLLALEHWCLGRRPFAMHLHSIAWFLLLVGLTASLYRRWFGSKLARWASLLYASAGLHAMSTAWIAARHTTVSAALSVLALWAHAHTREDEHRWGSWVCIPALLAALAAGEMALGIFPFLIAYEWARPKSDRKRWAWLCAFVALAVAYFGLYVGLGYGVYHSAMYVSPLSSPGSYLAAAVRRLPLLLGQLFLAVPSEIATVLPRSTRVTIFLGTAAALTVVSVTWHLRAQLEPTIRRNVTWLLIAASISLMPVLSTNPGGRLLPLALIGTAPVVALLLQHLWQWRARWLAWPLLLVLAATNLVLSPAWRLIQTFGFANLGRAHQRLAEEATFEHCNSAAATYLLTGADPMLSLYAGPAIVFHHPEKKRKSMYLLSSAPQDQRLTRIGPREFVLEVLGTRDANAFERLYSDQPAVVGSERHLRELSTRVEAVSGGLFTRVRLQLDQDPDTRDSCLLAWQNRRLSSLDPPRIGQSMLIRHELGPMGL